MADEGLLGPPRVRRRLAELRHKKLNFDVAAMDQATPENGWSVDDLCQPLSGEPPGSPVKGGSWELARRLLLGYEFADPSIVRAFYDTDTPLEERNMLLKLQAYGLIHIFVGVRVGEVCDETRDMAGRRVRVWGWNYRTLEGHVEMGQMDWEVWKWLDSGAVEFHIRAASRPAHIGNPFVRIGFRVLRGRERRLFLESTRRRMRAFTDLGLTSDHGAEALQRAGREATARPARYADVVDAKLTRDLLDDNDHADC